MKDLITYVTRNLVEDDAAVEVREVSGEKATVFELRVSNRDRGKIIGRQGRTVRALRALVNAAAAREGKRAVLEVVD